MTWNILFLVIEKCERGKSTKNSSCFSALTQGFSLRRMKKVESLRGLTGSDLLWLFGAGVGGAGFCLFPNLPSLTLGKSDNTSHSLLGCPLGPAPPGK